WLWLSSQLLAHGAWVRSHTIVNARRMPLRRPRAGVKCEQCLRFLDVSVVAALPPGGRGRGIRRRGVVGEAAEGDPEGRVGQPPRVVAAVEADGRDVIDGAVAVDVRVHGESALVLPGDGLHEPVAVEIRLGRAEVE